MALKLFAGNGQTRAYPTTERLLEFGRRFCGVAHPGIVLRRIAKAMRETLQAARTDARIPKALLASMAEVWAQGMVYAAPVPHG